MDATALLGFAAIAFTLIAVPGPDWAYVIATGTRDRAVIPAVAGLVGGYALLTATLVAGVGPLVTAVPGVLIALMVFGSVFLMYLGIRTLRTRPQLAEDSGGVDRSGSSAMYFRRGVAVSGLNPKGLLIFLAVLPQFVRESGDWPVPVQFAALGMVYLAITACFYLVLGFTAHRVLRARNRATRATTTVAGIAMIIVGAGLLAETVSSIVA